VSRLHTMVPSSGYYPEPAKSTTRPPQSPSPVSAARSGLQGSVGIRIGERATRGHMARRRLSHRAYIPYQRLAEVGEVIEVIGSLDLPRFRGEMRAWDQALWLYVMFFSGAAARQTGDAERCRLAPVNIDVDVLPEKKP